MGAAVSFYKLEKKHRLLGIAISNSTYIDPRHLEHLSYPLWTTEAAHIAASSGVDDFMIAPQFPMWVSEVEMPFLSSNPDVSGRTESDGDARGVFVDIAIMQPIIKARSLRVFRTHKALLLRMSLQTFVQKTILRDPVADLAPRCLWVDELWAPILIEIKTDVMRHPETLRAYVKALRNQLNAGKDQSREQGNCLFCSWRFASQDIVFLLAVVGAIWAVRRFTRADAAREFQDNKAFDPETLRALKDHRPPDDSWVKVLHERLWSTPLMAKENKRQLDEDYAAARTERATRRAETRDAILAAGSVDIDVTIPPNYDDRGLPIFREVDIEACHMKDHHEPFFETRKPEAFFAGTGGTGWTRALRLGTDKSDEYKEFLSTYLGATHLAQEVPRRKAEVFEE